MMGIVVIKTTQQDFFFIRLVVAIGVAIQHQISALGYIYTFRGDLKSVGQVQSSCKDYLFVGFTVSIGIFKNNEFIIGPFITGFIVRVTRHSSDPKPAFIVE